MKTICIITAICASMLTYCMAQGAETECIDGYLFVVTEQIQAGQPFTASENLNPIKVYTQVKTDNGVEKCGHRKEQK